MANNIAMGFQGIQLPDPLNAYAKVMSIQNAQNQNALAQYQMASAQRADADQNKLRETLAGFKPGMKFEDQYNALIGTGNLDAARKFAESHAKVSKDQREGEKSQTDMVHKKMEISRDFLSGVDPNAPTTPNVMMQWFKGALNDPHIGPLMAQYGATETNLADSVEQAIKTPGGMDKLVNDWRLGTTAYAKMNKPHFVNQTNGATNQTLSIPGMGGAATVVPGSVSNVTSTPHQLALEGAATNRLNQETATGTLSPETTDFLAETYRQTGNLPPMGMGRSAAEARNKVLTRAAELAMGGGKDAASAAGDVRTAKADTAGATSTIKDFSSGMSARRVTANNTAINHLATMEKLATDLSNTDVRVFNAAANMFAKATGATAPTSFDAARQLVASEVIKAVVNNGGGVTERQEAEEQFSRANSPEQLKGVINTYKELLAGQLDSLGKQYEVGSGRKDFDKRLTPETRKVFEKVRGVATPAPAATKSGATVSNWNE